MVGMGRLSNGSFSTSFSCGRLALAGVPPCTDTKDGQKPFRQEKSLLQLLWSICRLRPSSVSSGFTDTQLLLSEQSPQPSHTASLMNTRLAGSGKAGVGGYLLGSWGTARAFLGPSASTWRVISGTESGPSCGWPPVMATASL